MSPSSSDFLTIRHPEPKPLAHPPVYPVFLPFIGCSYRCIYCAQDVQTGVGNRAIAPGSLRSLLFEELAGSEPVELAFYGGTFTALPQELMLAYLDVAAELRQAGLVSRVRCSTRPDCLGPEVLALLARSGMDLVEIGIQSFDNDVLAASGRGYKADAAVQGCKAVRTSGLELGIQLLPGLPRMTPAVFVRDVAAAAALAPSVARLYPLLVLEGTALARRWRAGSYTPWDVDQTVDALADAFLTLWRAGIRVIRAGLAPESTLDDAFLAGPRHPAMGQRARSLALFRLLEPALAAWQGPVRLDYPRRFQGELWGHRGELVPAYAALGLIPGATTPHPEPWEPDCFRLSAVEPPAGKLPD
ncbi:radical SAM protein [Oceanidesulfovibrio marinus]|uniref:Radical SAM protein n=1 Tax=Oceanidesulfovibrio marinus TaxID=370038 RepID=A0A6P1ZJA8_9BACT|nr:radical SAM protein [Oceanidesulfovibrio marinus]TVM35791.1 radical SAM protein [Oceanidesulfovibrio marinus]